MPGRQREDSAEVLARKLRLDDLDVVGRRVLVRVDFNVPVEDGTVVDATRIEASLPTIERLVEEGAAVLLAAHRGRPTGRRDEALSLAPILDELRGRVDATVRWAADCVGEEVQEVVEGLHEGDLLLLENLRFHAGERANDRAFAAGLAGLAPLFVNDAFGACHRTHASIVGVPEHVEAAAAGQLLEAEVGALSRALRTPRSPFVLVLGGAKVTDKVGVVANLLDDVDAVLIGGAMALAFLAARGESVGASRVDEGAVASAREVTERVGERGIELLLPGDHVVAPDIESPEQARTVDAIPDGQMALDIGPRSAERFARRIAEARTVVWNGPVGVFEVEAFAAGTRRLARAMASVGEDGLTILGGGDTAAAARATGIVDRVTHVSTGGGAALDLLAGRVLPGVRALTDRRSD